MELILSVEDFKYIKNLRTYQLIKGECSTVGSNSVLTRLLDKNLIDRLVLKSRLDNLGHIIHCYQNDQIILSQTIYESDDHLIKDIQRKMCYEKRKEVLSLIL